MYYLNSRYYDSNIGRFINADGLLGEQGNILGHNMFAYTQNNPVMSADPSRYWSCIKVVVVAVIITVVVLAMIDGDLDGKFMGDSLTEGAILVRNGAKWLPYDFAPNLVNKIRESN